MNLKEFVTPPKQYRPCPILSLNGDIEAAELDNRVRDLKRKGVGGCMLKSDDGLRTRYLGEQWMKALRRVIEISRELGIECWIGDDDRAPSGAAGGLVSRDDADALAMSMVWNPDALSCDDDDLENAVAYTLSDPDGQTTISIAKPDDLTGYGVFFTRRYERGATSFNGENYADLLDPATVEKFIDLTHEHYSKQFRYDFGEHLPALFTDRAHVRRETSDIDLPENCITFPWCAGFAKYFEEFNGYEPWKQLHHLLSGSEDGFQFRHDYWTTINARLIETFTGAVAHWCHEHDLMTAGNAVDTGLSEIVVSGGSPMAQYEMLDIPVARTDAADIRDSFRLKQAVSVADQLDKERTGAIVFGNDGYGGTFTDYKRKLDFLFAHGVSYVFPDHHPYTIVGKRKRLHPSAISYHQPWWDHYRLLGDYISRCSWTMRQGRSAAQLLVMVPTASTYGSYDLSTEQGGETIAAQEKSLFALLESLQKRHVQYELGDEIIIARHGSADGGHLQVGKGEYSAVILPPARTWSGATLDLLESFTGTVLVMGEAPDRVNGEVDSRISELIANGKLTSIPDDPDKALKMLTGPATQTVSVLDPSGSEDTEILVNHRIDAAAHIIFLANTDSVETHQVTITVDALGGAVELDPTGGRAFRYASSLKNGKTIIETSLPPSGSRIFLVDQTQTSVEAHVPGIEEEALAIDGPYTFQRLHDNTLPLTTCTLTIDGKKYLNKESVEKAIDILWEKTGISDQTDTQPWALEERNMRTRTNKTVLTYSFTVTDVPEKIYLAAESADRFTVQVNDTAVKASAGNWHIDRRILVFNLNDIVQEGLNTITMETDYLWDTEIGRAYIYGDFAVGSQADGYPIITEPGELELGTWDSQGYTFYNGAMIYKLEFDLSPTGRERYEVDLSGMRGATAYVTVNETEVGGIPFPPYRGDITGALKSGLNTVEIEIISTAAAEIGGGTGTTEDESTVSDYGFVDPPQLVKITTRN